MALDIFYLSNSNDKESISWQKLADRFPYARFIKRSDSIVDTYKECAKKSYTTHFFVIPESLEVVDSFDFSYMPDEWSQSSVHVWKQKNSSGIETGHGGVFLFSKTQLLQDKIPKSEIESNYFTDCKFLDVIATITPKHKVYRFSTGMYKSNHDQNTLVSDTYQELLETASQDTESNTDFFWVVDEDVEIKEDFKFDFHPHFFNSNHVHVFQKENKETGLVYENGGVKLIPKRKFLSESISNDDYHKLRFKPLKYVNTAASQEVPYDIVMLSYYEPNADKHFEELKQQFPNRNIYRVDGVKGIFNAHKKASELVDTKMFYVIDADAKLVPGFNFDYLPGLFDTDKIHVWRSKNPINELIYGYGGIKLFPTQPLRDARDWHIDFTTSVGGADKFKPMPQVSNVTAFNTDPFSTWKSAFRECCKLSSRIIEKQKEAETEKRLNIWCTVGESSPFGKYAIHGAIAGRDYGLKFKQDSAKLDLINDFEWLKKEFDGYQSTIR